MIFWEVMDNAAELRQPENNQDWLGRVAELYSTL